MDVASGVGGLLVGLLGIVLTIYYARKAERLDKMRKRLDWSDVQAAACELAQRVKRDRTPDVIVTPGLPGATFANLLSAEFAGQPPVYVGTRTWKEDPHRPVSPVDSFVIETKKWIVTIPNAITTYPNDHILIVDDFVMSGDFLDALVQVLRNSGVDGERIRSASIAATKVAIKNHKAPDYYWWVADDDNFFFPWGKAK